MPIRSEVHFFLGLLPAEELAGLGVVLRVQYWLLGHLRAINRLLLLASTLVHALWFLSPHVAVWHLAVLLSGVTRSIHLLILLWRIVIDPEMHLFKHAFKGDPSLPLLNHLLVHTLVIVVVFPAALLSVVGLSAARVLVLIASLLFPTNLLLDWRIINGLLLH